MSKEDIKFNHRNSTKVAKLAQEFFGKPHIRETLVGNGGKGSEPEVELLRGDETLEDLGFIREDDGRYPTYRKGTITLMFDVDDKTYRISEWISPTVRDRAVPIDNILDGAIQKVKEELGW